MSPRQNVTDATLSQLIGFGVIAVAVTDGVTTEYRLTDDGDALLNGEW